jgi:hypothetical protein
MGSPGGGGTECEGVVGVRLKVRVLIGRCCDGGGGLAAIAIARTAEPECVQRKMGVIEFGTKCIVAESWPGTIKHIHMRVLCWFLWTRVA